MDIKQLYTAEIHEQGAEMQIRAPNGKYIDAYIKLIGVDSKTYRNVIKEAQTALALARIDKSKVVEAELTEYNLYAKTVLGWRGLQNGDEDFDFTPERCVELFKEAPYILDQVKRFQENRANFTKG